MPETDRRQFDALRARDQAACERFVREHYRELYCWLYRLTGRAERAEDLTQESFAAFWQSLARTTPNVSERTWLYSIARNQWRKHCRARRAGREQEESDFDEIAASTASPSAALEHREFAQALEAAMAELAPEFREVLSLRLWHKFSYAEIGMIQGIGADLARWRFFRARQRVRDRLNAWHQV